MDSHSVKKILLIDDDTSLHDLCRAVLTRFGYIFISALSGEEGLNKILSEEPDLILLDLMMPGIDGYQVFEKLQNDPTYHEYRNLPVIMLTAVVDNDELKNEMLKRGAAAYLNKPFGLNELVNIIQNALIVNEIKLKNISLQDEITTAKQYLERIIDHAPIGIVVNNKDGIISRANAFFATMMGNEHPKQIVGKNILDFSFSNQSEIQTHFTQAIERGESCSLKSVDVHNFHGQTLTLNIQCVPFHNELNQVTDMLSIWEDVTDIEKRAYEMSLLRQISEAMQSVLDVDILLNLILTSITAGCSLGFSRALIFLISNDRTTLEGQMGVGPVSEDDALQIWSKLSKDHGNLEQFLYKFGLKPPNKEDSFNKAVRNIRIDLEDKEDILVQTVLNQKSYWIKGKEQLIAQDLKLEPEIEEFFRPEEFVTAPLISRDRVVGTVIADNKYSNAPLTEEQIALLKLLVNHAALALENAEAYQKLEDKVQQLADTVEKLRETQNKLVQSERLATVGRMAAHVAHEIRNPLTAVGGFAKSILKEPKNAEHVKLSGQIIDKEVQRLEKTLRNVLNFSRITPTFKQKNDINQVIREIIALQKPFISDEISIEMELSDDIPEFYIDDEQIKQALMNVFSNSVSSIKDKGTITIKTFSMNEDVIIEIGDTGIGMSKEQLDNIFTPFYTSRREGTGLGLAVTQQIIEKHDGKIEVESELNKGSKFRFILPLVLEMPEEQTDENEKPIHSKMEGQHGTPA